MASDTSTVVKSGDILIEVTKFLVKSWQQRFCVLHRKTEKENADLCIYDSKDDFYKKKKTCKKIILENVKYIDKSTKTSKESKEYMLEFKCGREKHTLRFLTENDLNDWESHLRGTVDICLDSTDERSSSSVTEDPAGDGVFTDNIMYDRTEQAISFDVKIDENDTAKRCHLKGNYSIHISSTGIGLLDSKQNLVYSWPYSYIRRYGLENNKNLLVIEAGRKCDSGEGQFRFQSRKGQEIHDLIQSRFTQMQRSHNPMAIVAPLIPQQVAKRQGSNISEESDGSPHLPQRNQSTVSSSSRDGIHNSWVGNTEAEKISATNMRKSDRKSPDVIPRVPAAEKISVNGSEGDRRSVQGPAVSHTLSHVSANFQKELEEKLQKPDHSAVQQNVEDEQNDPKQNKKKTKKEEKRESDKEKKKKEGEKENNKKWSLFSKKMKENDRIKSSERDIKSDSSKDDQKPHHAVPNQSTRFYEEVDVSEPAADTSSTGLYSEPFEHAKDKKKLGRTKSNDGKKPPPIARKPQELYSEPITLANPQNIYSEAIKPGESGGPVVYSEANKFRQDAWKNYGEAEEFHEEDYMNIQSAREMQQQTSNEPPLPPRPSDFDDDDDGTYAGDSYYNKLDFEKKLPPNFKSEPASLGHIYGTSSGPVGPLPEQEYDSLSSGEEEEEEDQYAEADINPEDGYEETKPKPPLPKPLLSKPQKSHPPPESLYEDI